MCRWRKRQRLFLCLELTVVIRRPFLSRLDFTTEHMNARRPVILTGILQPWPALCLWSDPNYLKHRVGNQTVEVMMNRNADPLYELRCEQHRGHMPFSEFVDWVFSGQGNDRYLVANNHFTNSPGGQALLSDAPPPTEYLHSGNGGSHFWIGPAGTVTPLHYDTCDILLCQVIGAKRVVMIDPAQQHLLYNSVGVFSDVDYEKPDLARFPLFGQVMAEEFILNAGEAVFLPQGYWHCVRSLSSSISVSFTNFIRSMGN